MDDGYRTQETSDEFQNRCGKVDERRFIL